MDKPNFSAIARELGVDRRTVKKYYDRNIRKNRKSENPFEKQAQFDWKEDLKFSFMNGEEFIFNVVCLILSASRFKY